MAEWEEMKQMSLIEMDGFLKGKCIPSDLKVNETNAEYLVRKFGELESKLETALLECRSAGITIDNLEAKCEALLDERERDQQYIKSRDQENEDIALTVGKLRVELEAAENNLIDSECHVAELEEALRDKQALLEASEKRIAELEEREILLPERSSMLHRTDFHDDYQTVMAYKVSEVIDAIRAAGIRIKGE
ncbi:TPA: ead/Ea22-like family protein [Escherichia coli]|nr:ead/Ea22-like family protein [Escherichia coli]